MNPSFQFSTPHFRWLGYLVWFVLFLFSILFFKERSIFMDGAFQLFEMINEESFKLYHYRLPNPLTQILPVLAIKLHFPLKAVLIAYSINFILLHTILYHLIVNWLKNDFLGWALIFFFTLFSLDTFYFLPPELFQGSALLIFSFAIILRFPKMDQKWVLPALLILATVFIFAHKLVAIFFFFCWFFFFLKFENLRHKKYYSLAVWVILLMIAHSLFFVSWYDAIKQDEFFNHLNNYFPNFHQIPAHLIFLKKCFTLYYCLPLLLAIVSFYYLKNKEWLKLAGLYSFLFGYLLIVHIGDPKSPYRFYSEANYLPLSILLSIPLLFDVLPKFQKYQKFILGSFFLIVTLRLVTIAQNHQTFEDRHNWCLSQLEATESLSTNRLWMHKKEAPMDTVIQEWVVPYETILLTALEHSDSVKTLFIIPDYENYKHRAALESENGYFFSVFKKIEIEEINQRYFNLGKKEYVRHQPVN